MKRQFEALDNRNKKQKTETETEISKFSKKWGHEASTVGLSGKFIYKEHFNPEFCYFVALIGSRFSGKSTLLGNHWEEITESADLNCLFCNNPQAGVYEYVKDRRFLFEEYNPKIIKDCRILNRRLDNLLKINFMFDDCSSDAGNKYDQQIVQTAITGRNFNATMWFSTQALTFLQKKTRANLDFVFLFRTNTDDEQESMVKKFIQGLLPFPSYMVKKSQKEEYMKDWYNAMTENHSCIFINLRERKMYTYKAPSTFGPQDTSSTNRYK